MIPGSNLLKAALTVIASQTAIYERFLSRAINTAGSLVPTYAAPVTITGSLQRVPRTLYEQYGLDFEKSYYTFYTSNPVLVTGRDVSGDKLTINSQVYQCEADNDWFAVDGWTGVLCILDT